MSWRSILCDEKWNYNWFSGNAKKGKICMGWMGGREECRRASFRKEKSRREEKWVEPLNSLPRGLLCGELSGQEICLKHGNTSQTVSRWGMRIIYLSSNYLRACSIFADLLQMFNRRSKICVSGWSPWTVSFKAPRIVIVLARFVGGWNIGW